MSQQDVAPPMRKCRKCKVTKQRSCFTHKKPLRVCDDCIGLWGYLGPGLTCRKCKEKKALSEFHLSTNGTRRQQACKLCVEKYGRPPGITCRKCKERKPQSEFEGGDSWRTRGRYCLPCDAQRQRRRDASEVVKSPNPCQQCGGEIADAQAPCRVRALKYCSFDCRRIAATAKQRTCKRCKKKKAYDEFGYKSTGGRSHACRECVSERSRDAGLGLKGRPTAHQMHRFLLARIWREGKQSDVRPAHTRKMYKGECSLCTRAVSSIRSRDGQDYSVAALRGYCRRCVKLLRVFDHSELLLLSHEIAAKNPL